MCINFCAYSQLSVSPSSDRTTLVNSIIGSGMQVTNVTLNCNGEASGVFSASNTNLGLTSGIILATGTITQARGPNNSIGDNSILSNPNCFSSSESFFDPDITSIEPKASYDGCMLEFDVMPVCSTLTINYVFASEEYPEFVCSEFNDAFGFFITGPNPSGGNYISQNIAKLPNGQPVSINSVNGGNAGSNGTSTNCTSLTNTAYYTNNANGSSIQYDGFTVPLVAQANVSPCSNYHLKLVIADAGDCQYSSAVFLSHGGLTCPQTEVPQVTSSSTPVTCGNNGSATVTVSGYSNPITFNWQPGGQSSPTATNLGAGTYTCTLGYMLPCPYTQSVTVNLSGNNLLTVTSSSTNAYCGNPTGTAAVSVSGGIPPYSSILWNTTPTQTGSSIDSLIPGLYTATVSDASACTITKDVAVGNTTPTITVIDKVIQSTCQSPNGDIYIDTVFGGTDPYSFIWNTTPITTTPNLIDAPAGTYTLTIGDSNNCAVIKQYILTNVDSVLVDVHTVNEYCNQGNGEIHVPIINGIAPYTWIWSNDSLLNINDSIITNLKADVYHFVVTDNVGCTSRGTVSLSNVNDVFSGTPYTRPSEPIVDVSFALGITLPSQWDITQIVLPDGSTRTNESEVTLNYADYGYYNASFYIISSHGCKDTVDYTFFVKDFMTIYIPNAFTPNLDKNNKVWYVYGTLVREISIFVFNREGEQIFESHSLEDGWDGTYKGRMCGQDTYVYKVYAKDYFDETHKYVGHIHLIR